MTKGVLLFCFNTNETQYHKILERCVSLIKKNLKLDAQNSGTLGRLILGLLVNSPVPIYLTGDKSLSKRDFSRVSNPLSKFGAKFKLKNSKFLPLISTATAEEASNKTSYISIK